jgi:hypothetical protein
MPLDEHAWMLMLPTAILSVLTFTVYFAYRIYCLVIAQRTIQPANALGLAWFFLAIEFLIFGVSQFINHEVKPGSNLTLFFPQLAHSSLSCSEALLFGSQNVHSSVYHGTNLKMSLQSISSSHAAGKTPMSCSTL